MRLKGQVAIVTGARRGIGFAAAKCLCEEGAAVVLTGRDPAVIAAAESLKKLGYQAVGVPADLTQEQDVKRLVDQAVKQFGRVDILVNNAGVVGVGGVESVTIEQWKSVMDNNVTTAFLCSKHVTPIMKAQKRGVMINVSSVAGRSSSMVAGVHYTSSKAAMIGLTRQLARELSPSGIRVNAVAPSQTKTEMLVEGLEKSGKNIDDIAAKIPLGYIASAEQVASVIKFLCLDDSSYMTGAILDVNGGLL
jgi:3-oxoacyl-[acyl-carrier protein] reductase